MSVVVVLGSACLIGSEASVFLNDQGSEIVCLDDMRRVFFGDEAPTR